MFIPNCAYGEEGVLLFADCGIIPDPSPRQLANIAVCTSSLAKEILDIVPRVAMLSYSTKDSASGRFVDKIKEATSLAKNIMPDLIIDGELQVDAAIVPDIAKIKDPGGVIAGKANILIFPNLESGNISYKLVERLTRCRAIGPILQGLNFPCSDLSRGCSAEDVVDCVAVTSIRAQKAHGQSHHLSGDRSRHFCRASAFLPRFFGSVATFHVRHRRGVLDGNSRYWPRNLVFAPSTHRSSHSAVSPPTGSGRVGLHADESADNQCSC